MVTVLCSCTACSVAGHSFTAGGFRRNLELVVRVGRQTADFALQLAGRKRFLVIVAEWSVIGFGPLPFNLRGKLKEVRRGEHCINECWNPVDGVPLTQNGKWLKKTTTTARTLNEPCRSPRPQRIAPAFSIWGWSLGSTGTARQWGHVAQLALWMTSCVSGNLSTGAHAPTSRHSHEPFRHKLRSPAVVVVCGSL